MATVQYNNDVDNKPRCIHCGSPAHEGYEVQYIQTDVHGRPTGTILTCNNYQSK